MRGGELHRLIGDVGRRAQVGRQVAQFAGVLHAGGDGLALREGDLVAARDGQLRQAGFVDLLLAQRGGVAIAGVVGGDHGLTHGPGGIAAGHRQLGQGEQGMRHRAGLERARRIGDGLQVLRYAELGRVAQADRQHARGGDAGQVVQDLRGAGLAAQVAARQQGRQAAAGGFVDSLGGRAERRVGKGADHDAIDGRQGRRIVVQGEFQRH